MKKVFEVMSSDGTAVYCVSFELDYDKLYVSCSCQAGSFWKWCKHKTQLALGNLSCLRNEVQSGELYEVLEWVKSSSIAQLVSEIQVAEIEMLNAKARKERATKQLERVSREGA